MAKNLSKRGKSVRNGNSPSPYTKYGKIPYRYSFDTGKIKFVDFNPEKQKQQYRDKKKRAA